MSILIKGMEMPKENDYTIAIVYGDGVVTEYHEDYWIRGGDGEKQIGTALPVPPHGRLIDADAFIAEQRHLYCENCERRKGMKNGKMKFVYDIGDAPCRSCGYGDVLDDIDDTPTIIEAEEVE